MSGVQRVGIGIALALLLPASAAVAQQREPASVPLELAQALISLMSPGAATLPEVRVGTLPEPLERALRLPPGARIVGSSISPHSSHGVLALPVPAEAAIQEVEEHLLRSGWAPAARVDRGGFLASAATEALPLCREDGASISLFAGRSGEREQYLSVFFHGNPRHSVCQQRAHRPTLPGSPVPSLAPPPGSLVRGSGSGGGYDRAEAYAEIQTDLVADALLRHYGTQLREHGWRAKTGHSGPDLAVQTWEWTDAEGVPWQGVMVVTHRREPRTRDVLLRVIQVHPGGNQ